MPNLNSVLQDGTTLPDAAPPGVRPARAPQASTGTGERKKDGHGEKS